LRSRIKILEAYATIFEVESEFFRIVTETRVALGLRCGSALLASAIEVRLPRMLDGPFGQSPAGFVPSMLRIGRTSPG
jgi:hypothetical protein